MTTIYDVAKYISESCGELLAMKLQKLMYYAQAWNLVWEEKPLFDDDFEAWANGPVLPKLYKKHCGLFNVDGSLFDEGDVNKLSDSEKSNIKKVVEFYGDHSALYLSNLTHQEDPWLKAREGLDPGVPSRKIISKSAMHEYYSSL